MENTTKNKAYFHLPGLFEFYELIQPEIRYNIFKIAPLRFH